MPDLFVIAGCNGAGKTTLSKNLLPGYMGIKEFVNADEIARGISPFNPEGAAFTAGRIMLERIRDLTRGEVDFAIETTLSTRSYAQLFKRMKQQKYEIFLLFVYLDNSKEAIKRVKQRVSEGGHDIPNDVIVRRFERGLKNLKRIYFGLADEWVVIDNSPANPIFVAEKRKDKTTIHHTEIWNKINQYGQT